MKPIYIPSGKAKEYGDYAINIYTGCPHRCYYCFAPSVLHKDKETFHSIVEPRRGIVEAVAEQLIKEQIRDKLIHLCFTCDPYPVGVDSSTTRAIIRVLKNHGNHVQILTKNGNDAMRDFDLLDGNDWYGVTYAGYNEPSYSTESPKPEQGAGGLAGRLYSLCEAHERGIHTWVSCEPVLVAHDVLNLIQLADYVDKWKIGKLNYHPSDINWNEFGHTVERLCKSLRRDYYIKDALRKEMGGDECQ